MTQTFDEMVTGSSQPTLPAKPITDLSARVVQLARVIDRLPPGTFEITIKKQDVRSQDWQIDIVRTESIQHLTISKYQQE